MNFVDVILDCINCVQERPMVEVMMKDEKVAGEKTMAENITCYSLIGVCCSLPVENETGAGKFFKKFFHSSKNIISFLYHFIFISCPFNSHNILN